MNIPKLVIPFSKKTTPAHGHDQFLFCVFFFHNSLIIFLICELTSSLAVCAIWPSVFFSSYFPLEAPDRKTLVRVEAVSRVDGKSVTVGINEIPRLFSFLLSLSTLPPPVSLRPLSM